MNQGLIRISWLERTLAGLNGIARKRRRNAMPAHLTVGIDGEDAVFFYLLCKGYTVARRWSSSDARGDVKGDRF